MKKTDELKYLFITRTLTGGGAERFISTFASFMADQGYDVHILTYETSDQDYPLSSNVTRHVMPYVEESIRGKFLRILRMKQALEKIEPDVLIPFVDTVVICTFMVNLLLKKKFVFTVRVSPWHETGSRFSKFMRKVIARKTDAIMLQNTEQEEYYPQSYHDRIFIVPNPVAAKFESCRKEVYSEELRKICALGRISTQKNFSLLISAVKANLDDHPDICLQIFGEGEEREALEKLIVQENLSDVCRLMGRTSNVEAVLKETDLFVLSSDFEGMPNALIEAMAMGVPCISSDCRTGPKSMIRDGQTGLLFRTGNLDSLTEKMAWALNHADEMNQMGKEAREDVLNTYRIEKTLSSFIQMIDDIY